ncbi:flagellar hook assembly protein FlgD [bacterium]|nr:flagellar hook assembly protein FlgD [bacterium]
MDISSLTGSSTSSTGASKDSLGKDDFLKLLITKLQNQDPLNPTSDEAFVADLAQFSSLEQMENMNSGIQDLALLQSNATNTTMVQYIGKTAHLAGNQLSLSDGNAQIGFELPQSAKKVSIQIYNEAGQLVRTIEKDSVPAGSHYVDWDGTKENGYQLPDGNYKVSITAQDGSGSSISVITRTSGVISGVTFENGYPELVINGTSYTLGSVISVSE